MDTTRKHPPSKKKGTKRTTNWLYPALALLAAALAAMVLIPREIPTVPSPPSKQRVYVDKASSSGDCKVYDGLPSPKEFFKEFVQKGEPVIVRNAMNSASWKSIRASWTNEYLKEHFEDVKVLVSMSPNQAFEYAEESNVWSAATGFWREWLRLGDDEGMPREVLSELPQGREFKYRPCSALSEKCHRFTVDKVLVRPAKRTSTLGKFLELGETNVSYYIQYESIPEELKRQLNPPEWFNYLPFDMTGLWMGKGHTRANLHYDANENLMFMCRGSKRWTLFPPEQSELLYEGFCKETQLEETEDPSLVALGNLTLQRNQQPEGEDGEAISMSFFNSPVTLKQPDYDRFPLLKQAKAKVCTLKEGEVLYLPAFWWHEVESSPGDGDRSLGINYWYSPYRKKPIPCPTCSMQVNREDFPKDPW